MADKQTYYAESLTESQTTETSFVDKVVLQFTPDANSTYAIIATWQLACSAVDNATIARLIRTSGTPATFATEVFYPKVTSDYGTGGGIAIESFGESPSQQTYKIQYEAAAATSYIKYARLFAIKLVATDEYATDYTESYTTSTSLVDKLTKQFTPASSDDYVIFAAAFINGSGTTADTECQMEIDSTGYDWTNIETCNSGRWYPFMVMKKVTLDASQHTIKIQYSTESASKNTTGIRDAVLLIFRADEFPNVEYGEEDTRTTHSNSALWSPPKAGMVRTLPAQNFYIFACAGVDSSSTSVAEQCRHLNFTNSIDFCFQQETPNDATTRHLCVVASTKFTIPTEVEKTFYTTFKPAAAATAGCQDNRWVLFQLTSSTGTTYYQSIPATGGSTAILSKLTTWVKLLQATEIASATIGRANSFYRSLLATEIGLADVGTLSTFYRTLQATESAIASIKKLMYQTLTATGGSTTSLGTIKTIQATLSAIETSVATLQKQVHKTLSATGGSTASLNMIKTLYVALSAIEVSIANLQKQMYKTLSTSSGSSASMVMAKMFQTTLEVIEVSIATLQTLSTYYRSLLGTSGSTGDIAKQSTYYRILSVAEDSLATLTKLATYYRSLIATEISVPMLDRLIAKILPVIEVSIATLTGIANYFRNLSATGSSQATLGRVFTWIKSLPVTLTSVPVISRTVSYFRTLATQEISIASLRKGLYKILSVIESGIPYLNAEKILEVYYKTLEAIAASTAQISRLLTWTKTLSVTEVASAALTRLLSFYRTLSVIETTSTVLVPARLWFKQLISTAGSFCSLVAYKIPYMGIQYIRKVFYNVQRRIFR